MNRLFFMTLIKLFGEACLIALCAAIAILIIGAWRQWDSSIQYSNAFFLAGCLIFIGGGISRMAAGQEWASFQRFGSDSFGDMSPSERANFIVEASSPVRLVIVGVLSGILLFVLSALTYYLWPAVESIP
jgi:hypothetical protein